MIYQIHLIISQYNIPISSEQNAEYAYYTIIYTKLQLFYLDYLQTIRCQKAIILCKNQSKLGSQGRKAMYSILKKCRNLNLPVDIQLELFDTMVLPVAMYGCEVC
jgi:hypothetical protein